MHAKTAHPALQLSDSEASEQHENNNDDQNEANDAYATMPETVAVAAEAATEAA
jgi:hypothetical protein